MDNQQDQFGTSNTNDDTNRNSQNPAATASGASASSRKSASNPSAQSTSATPDASSQSTANAGSSRQGEGQQTNDQEGTLLDTALNSGKKWIKDSGVLDNVNQLPQGVKDWGSRALSRVNELSTTQKVVGGAILAAGLGWLALRKGKSSSSDSASYNYGKQRDTGSYGRRSYGYQAPDASTSRKSASGASSRSDSGSPYGNSGSRYGGSGANYGSGSSYKNDSSSNTGINSGSGRSETSTGASAFTDHGARTSESSHGKNDDFRSIE
jgi:hypothetical protein